MKKLYLSLALASSVLANPAHAETLDNAKVEQLVHIGLGDEAIVAKIKSSATQFDVSTDGMIALNKAGVSSPIIAAMIEAGKGASVSENALYSSDSPNPKVPHASGVYLLAQWLPEPKMLVIDPTTSNQTKTGGFLGYALTGGIASMSFKTVVPSAHARVAATNTRPTFYFYFDQANRSLSNGGSASLWLSGSVTSPNEFSLVRFQVKNDRRDAKVGKFNIGGAKSGVMDEDRIPFTYHQIVPGVFEARPDRDLVVGEYGFIYSASTGGGIGMAGVGAMTSRIFDFSLQADGPAAHP